MNGVADLSLSDSAKILRNGPGQASWNDLGTELAAFNVPVLLIGETTEYPRPRLARGLASSASLPDVEKPFG